MTKYIVSIDGKEYFYNHYFFANKKYSHTQGKNKRLFNVNKDKHNLLMLLLVKSTY